LIDDSPTLGTRQRTITKRLLILRHAKSSRKDSGVADHDRPLAPRGRQAAELMAEHLSREPLAPQLVLCSSARRTRETLERIAPGLGEEAAVRIEPELYAASAQRLLERLRAVEEGVESLLLIGHNPGLEELAVSLAASGNELAAMRRKYPTGALATLEFGGRWRELQPGRAELRDFVTPKQLAKR
jgi:phosphohistidine phosphatase